MRKLLGSVLLIMLAMNVANAGMLGDWVDSKTTAKEKAKVDLPLKAIKKNDSRIKEIEALAAQVAIKHKWKIQVSCPSNQYCKKIKKDVHDEAWRIARSKVSSDYAAKAKMPKIQVVQASKYQLILMTKGF